MLQKDLEIALYSAVREAQQRCHEYLTLEHLLYVLCTDKETIRVLKGVGVNPKSLMESLEDYLKTKVETLPENVKSEPIQTIAFQRVMQRAIMNARASDKKEVNGGDVLVSLFSEPDTHSVYLLEKRGISRLDVAAFIVHGFQKESGEEDWDEDDEFYVHDKELTVEEEDVALETPLKSFCVELVQKAKKGKIDPLIGREAELERTIQVLCRRRKNNPIFVGEAGVGKTAIAEGLALRIAQGDVPDFLKNTKIYSLGLGSLVAGTKFRGQFEQRLKLLIKALQNDKNAILFIDEIHTLIGAGATSSGTMDAANLMKPALSSGTLRCIGATTYDEYRQSFERDKAMARRFQKIEVEEPTADQTFEIVKGLKRSYENFHKVTYTDEVLRHAVKLADKHITGRFFPDKAIDVIDEVGSLYRSQRSGSESSTVTLEAVEKVVASIARIPSIKVQEDDKSSLMNLTQTLKNKVFGQDSAVEALTRAVKMSRAGLNSPEKPVGSFLFAGPTGVGKTEVAKQLAASLGIDFLRFDMSEHMERHTVSRLIGAPAGYLGYEGGGLLTEAVLKSPHAVLLLDEVEKAHPDVHNILLQVMDAARLTDNTGRVVDFRNVILIMTSNAGAFEITQNVVGFNKGIDVQKNSSKALEQAFTPEFRNRLDDTIVFQPLQPEVMCQVVDKFLDELSLQLSERNVRINVTQEAKEWLASEGYDPIMGARPLGRVIQKHIKQPLAEEMLFGRLEETGGTAKIDVLESGDGLSFYFRKQRRVKVTTSSIEVAEPA